MAQDRKITNLNRERMARTVFHLLTTALAHSGMKEPDMERLLAAMVSRMPAQRKWVLDDLADIAGYTASIDPRYLPYVKALKAPYDRGPL